MEKYNKKKDFILLVFLFITIIGYCQVTPKLVDKASNLKKHYFLSKTKSQVKYKKLFFNEFPSTFLELNQLYGYNDNTSGILYSESHEHICLFINQLKYINIRLVNEKLFSLAVGGKWDADGISDFQHGLRNHVLTNVNSVVLLFKNKSDDDIKSFWYFFFDGPHPQQSIPVKLERIRVISPKIYNLMIHAHEDVLKNSDS